MPNPKDPLLESEATDRVHYALGVLLDAGDFIAEQTYHRGRLARALAYLHGPGTVAGLRVVHYSPEDKDPITNGEISVWGGMAIDPLGRLIEVPSDACIRVKQWYESYDPDKLFKRSARPVLGSDHQVEIDGYNVTLSDLPEDGVVADLFLRFCVCERGKTPAFAAGPFDATDAVMPSRLRDGYELRLVPRAEKRFARTAQTQDWTQQYATDAPNALRDLILDAWRGNRKETIAGIDREEFLPPELLPEKDKAWVFLARVVIGVEAETLEGGRPKRTGTVVVDNHIRRFCFPPAALAQWLGIIT